MDAMRSAIIIAGGIGRRLGAEKSLIDMGGRPLIQLSVDKLFLVAEEVIVVARDQAQADLLRDLVPRAKLACDRISGYGPVAGILSGMACARGRYAAAVGCDLPFLNISVLERLFEIADGYEGAVPVHANGKLEPLHAVYEAKKMERACEHAIEKGMKRISAPISELNVKLVPVESLKFLDPELLTLFNINTCQDLEEARRIWKALDLEENKL